MSYLYIFFTSYIFYFIFLFHVKILEILDFEENVATAEMRVTQEITAEYQVDACQ